MTLAINQKLNISSSSGTISEYNVTVSGKSNEAFNDNIFRTIDRIGQYSETTANAIDDFSNVIILKDKTSEIPEEYFSTAEKLDKYASEAYGFVSKDDSAIVIIQDNHQRKNVALEGNIEEQGADTIAHEIGHLVDDELSTTDSFKKAYLTDLKRIEKMLSTENASICGEDLKTTLIYLKHYMEGVNFEDGISEDDITRTGLRENFAECFSTIMDENPTKINEIYSTLFPNTMAQTRALIV